MYQKSLPRCKTEINKRHLVKHTSCLPIFRDKLGSLLHLLRCSASTCLSLDEQLTRTVDFKAQHTPLLLTWKLCSKVFCGGCYLVQSCTSPWLRMYLRPHHKHTEGWDIKNFIHNSQKPMSRRLLASECCNDLVKTVKSAFVSVVVQICISSMKTVQRGCGIHNSNAVCIFLIMWQC